MNNTKYTLKDKALIIALFIIMLYSAFCCYYANDIAKTYKEYTIYNTQFEDYNGNRLDSLVLENGVMTSTNDINFMVIGDRDILNNPIKTITLNTSYLSCEPVETRLYVLNTYESYPFTLSQGSNTIVLPEANLLNAGNKPVLIRIDLLNGIGEQVRVDSVVFNSKAVCYNSALRDIENNVIKFTIPIALLLLGAYVLKLGLSQQAPDKGKTISAIVLFAVSLLIKKFILDIFIINVLLGFSIMWLIAVVYYYITLYLIDKLKKPRLESATGLLIILLSASLFLIDARLFLFFAFYPIYIFGYYYGKCNSTLKYRIPLIIIGVLSSLLLFKVSYQTNYIVGQYVNINTHRAMAYILSNIFIASIAVLALGCGLNAKALEKNSNIYCKIIFPITFAYSLSVVANANTNLIIAILGIVLGFSLALLFNYLKPEKSYITIVSKTDNNVFQKHIIKMIIAELMCVFLVLFFEAMVKHMLFDMPLAEVFTHIKAYMFTAVFFYNLLLVNVIYSFFVALSGIGLGTLLFLILNGLLFLGNFVKLRFHDAMLKPGDLLQVTDFLSIVESAMRPRYAIIIILILALAVFVIYKLRKVLKPKFNIILVLVALISVVYVCSSISANKLDDIGITSVDKWLNDELRTQRQGFYIFTYYNVLSIKDIIPSEPEDYSEETMQGIKQSFDQLSKPELDDTKPDVIMLMVESMFDIEAMPGLSFSEEVEKNIKANKTLNLISPTFGGGTANVEFEALTGFSSYFMADNVSPYVTYWNSDSAYIPSVAHEFKRSGYKTVAIHPNNADFYNRDIVYKAMGFDDFVSIEDMKPNIQRNKRSYVLNTEFMEVVKSELAKDDTPKFMFALNIENHNPYDIQDSEATVEITGDISTADKAEAEVYANTLNNDDKMVGEIIEYVKTTDRPTLLYIWGDHLPMLGVLANTGYITDVHNKHTTPIIMYSNYKNIGTSIEEFTPNQLAAQAVLDSGIEHSSYFDFIYSLRNTNPVIHKSFAVDENSEEIQIYNKVYYDLLFGERYLQPNP